MNATSEHLAACFRLQGAGCAHMGSTFYAEMCELCARDAEVDGPIVAAMGAYAAEPFERAYTLRLLGGLHRMALAGESAELRAHYPSTGGDGDAGAAWPAIDALLRARDRRLLDALDRPLQTNEVGRSAALAGGLAVVARETGLPLHLLELGSSAALNLRLDRYWYEADGRTWGDAASTVRFVELWDDGVPPFDPSVKVVARRGCDLAPIDATAPGTDLTLLSFVWPGQEERFTTLQHALEIAHHMPVDVDTMRADVWLPEQLATERHGVATVVFHSIVWQYFPDETRAAIVAALDAAGARATRDAPLAWVRLEPNPRMAVAELRCTTWPGGDERLLATTGFHAGRVRWHGG